MLTFSRSSRKDMESIEINLDEHFLIHRTKFIVILILQIPAVVLYALLFIYFAQNRLFIQNRTNQALIILLIINFVQVTTNIPLVSHFYQLGRVNPATVAYCTWWSFWEFTLTGANEFLMATISIQRHFLIFQSPLLQNRQWKIVLHHVPIVFSLVYPIVFYFSVVVLYRCDDSQLDFTSNICGLSICYLVHNKALATFDWTINVGSPIVVIIFANSALVIRVLRQKFRHQRIISWRKQRRMTVQLLVISCLYLLTWSPNIITALIQQIYFFDFLHKIQINYIYDLTYLICLLIPWIYVGLYRDFIRWLSDKISQMIQCHRLTPRRIHPVQFHRRSR